MREIIISDQRMNADCRRKTDCSRNAQCLPQVARILAAQGAEPDGDAGGRQHSAESGAVVGDQRHETRADPVQIGDGQIHIRQILRHENGGHSDDDDGQAAENHSRRREQQTNPSDPGARLPRKSRRFEKRFDVFGFAQMRVRFDQSDRENRQQKHGRRRVPNVQITVAEIRQKTGESDCAADDEKPLRPGATLAAKEIPPPTNTAIPTAIKAPPKAVRS